MTVPVEQRQEWIKGRRQRRKIARGARFRRQLARYLVLGLILFGGWSGFSQLPWSLQNGGQDIIVKGNRVATEQQIRDSLKNVGETPIYKLNPRQLANQVASLKAVRYAFVHRYAFPSPRLVVEVLEEYPWATFAPNPDSEPEAIIAQSGRMIPIKDFPNVVRPPLTIYGANAKFSSADVAQWSKWCSFIAAQTGIAVDSVDLRDSSNIAVRDGELNLKLGTQDSSLTRRLGRLCSVLTSIEPLKGRLEYVDLSLDNNIPLKVAKKDTKDRSAMTAAIGHSI